VKTQERSVHPRDSDNGNTTTAYLFPAGLFLPLAVILLATGCTLFSLSNTKLVSRENSAVSSPLLPGDYEVSATNEGNVAAQVWLIHEGYHGPFDSVSPASFTRKDLVFILKPGAGQYSAFRIDGEETWLLCWFDKNDKSSKGGVQLVHLTINRSR
jgi:hypothetical protein